MRGLKPKKVERIVLLLPVASFTDAWIETQAAKRRIMQARRAHLLQMRGLKRERGCREFHLYESHLLQMRGLKQIHDTYN